MQTTPDQTDQTRTPSGRTADRHPAFLTVFPSIMLPMFLAVVDQTIVATALPAIAATLGQIGRASWVVIAYLISTTVAAPVYLKRLSQMRPIDLVMCVASLVLLMIPAVGSVVPIPDPPVNYFPYAYLVYLSVGIAWVLAFRARKPAAIGQIHQDLALSHARFAADVLHRVQGVAQRLPARS